MQIHQIPGTTYLPSDDGSVRNWLHESWHKEKKKRESVDELPHQWRNSRRVQYLARILCRLPKLEPSYQESSHVWRWSQQVGEETKRPGRENRRNVARAPLFTDDWMRAQTSGPRHNKQCQLTSLSPKSAGWIYSPPPTSLSGRPAAQPASTY